MIRRSQTIITNVKHVRLMSKNVYTYENRYGGIVRDYPLEEVESLKGRAPFLPDCTIARVGSDKLWKAVTEGEGNYINALGCITGGQAVQMAKAGLKSIYMSGWQVAADANSADQVFPDQSLYPADSGPKLVKRINNALMRADQIAKLEAVEQHVDYMLPVVADAEAGFGGALNAFEVAKNMIMSGAAGLHFEDQLASEKKCGHMGGKVLVPTSQFIRTLNAARLASDILQTHTLIIARTDAQAANMITSDADKRDHKFLTNERTPEGFYVLKNGIDTAIDRSLSYAPYADLLWCETDRPDLKEAKYFAESIHEYFPGKPLAYNCSPSFNWSEYLTEKEIENFQKDLGKLGFRYQFITLAGFHNMNHAMFKMARAYRKRGMSAFVEIQNDEMRQENHGFTARKHQREVGASYFDRVTTMISGGQASTTALKGSTEEEQFEYTQDLENFRSSFNSP